MADLTIPENALRATIGMACQEMASQVLRLAADDLGRACPAPPPDVDYCPDYTQGWLDATAAIDTYLRALADAVDDDD
jgi:hypothetical protein